MQNFERTLELSNYTVQLYRELFEEPHPIGSGLLIYFQNQHLLISANHVIDLEDERIKIENDPDEIGIPQNDMESIKVKGKNSYFNINDKVKAMVCTGHFDGETEEIEINKDIEWCVCELSEDIVEWLIEKGKIFYKLDERFSLNIKTGTQIFISGYPKYAQKENQETYRSFVSELLEDFNINESSLFRVRFNQDKAYCLELKNTIQIRPRKEGISGMSGGGLWYKGADNFIPLGIILQQGENYVEGYSLYEILKSYQRKTYE